MLKRFTSWIVGLFRGAVEAPPVWPDDVWERMLLMGKHASRLELPPNGIRLLDYEVSVYTDTIDNQYRRLEMLIAAIEATCDSPDAWDERRRDLITIPLLDYLFNKRFGYRSLEEINKELIEKVTVIHNLLDTMQINPTHDYYHYMRKEFYSIASDTVEMFQICYKIGTYK